MPEHDMLFADTDVVVVPSKVLLYCVAGADDMPMFSSSDAVKSIASLSWLPTEDLSSSVKMTQNHIDKN